jgi:hypothetical protein
MWLLLVPMPRSPESRDTEESHLIDLPSLKTCTILPTKAIHVEIPTQPSNSRVPHTRISAFHPLIHTLPSCHTPPLRTGITISISINTPTDSHVRCQDLHPILSARHILHSSPNPSVLKLTPPKSHLASASKRTYLPPDMPSALCPCVSHLARIMNVTPFSSISTLISLLFSSPLARSASLLRVAQITTN